MNIGRPMKVFDLFEREFAAFSDAWTARTRGNGSLSTLANIGGQRLTVKGRKWSNWGRENGGTSINHWREMRNVWDY